MKTKKSRFTYSVLVISLICFISLSASLQAAETTITRSIKLKSGDVVSVRSSAFDILVQTWDKSELSVDYKLSVEAKKAEEGNEFLKIFTENIEASLKNSQSVTDPFSSLNQINGKITVKFENSGRKFEMKEMKGSIIVKMPKQNALKASTSFHKLEIEDLDADAFVSVNSGNLKMGTCRKLELRSSFSRNMSIGNVEQADIDINSGGLKIGAIKNDLTLKGNFSDVDTGKTGNTATINFNSGSFTATQIGVLDLKGNFIRNFATENIEKAIIDINSSEFKAKKINTLDIGKTSFSTYNIEEADNITIGNSSSSKFFIGQLNSMEATQCSFSNFDINQLKSKLITKSSSGSIHLRQVMAGFDEIKIDGQFVTTQIDVSDDCNYRLTADLTFPQYNFSNISYDNHQKNMSHETMTGWHGNKEKATSKIGLNCQSCNIEIK
jgi:hypothetical protein